MERRHLGSHQLWDRSPTPSALHRLQPLASRPPWGRLDLPLVSLHKSVLMLPPSDSHQLLVRSQIHLATQLPRRQLGLDRLLLRVLRMLQVHLGNRLPWDSGRIPSVRQLLPALVLSPRQLPPVLVLSPRRRRPRHPTRSASHPLSIPLRKHQARPRPRISRWTQPPLRRQLPTILSRSHLAHPSLLNQTMYLEPSRRRVSVRQQITLSRKRTHNHRGRHMLQLRQRSRTATPTPRIAPNSIRPLKAIL